MSCQHRAGCSAARHLTFYTLGRLSQPLCLIVYTRMSSITAAHPQLTLFTDLWWVSRRAPAHRGRHSQRAALQDLAGPKRCCTHPNSTCWAPLITPRVYANNFAHSIEAVPACLLICAAAVGAGCPAWCCVGLVTAAEACEAAQAAVGGHLVHQILHSLQHRQQYIDMLRRPASLTEKGMRQSHPAS